MTTAAPTATSTDSPEATAPWRLSATSFAGICVLIAVGLAGLTGWAPIGVSIVGVFLFAGPHNWLEFRYLLTRMPASWGPLWSYFALAVGGVIALTVGHIALPWVAESAEWDEETYTTAYAGWNAAFVLWVAGLAVLRGQQVPGRDWSWAGAVGLLVVAAVLAAPLWFSVLLIFLHPLMALAFLDREIARRRPDWLRAYRASLTAVPVLLGVLYWQLAAGPDLPGEDALTERIVRHSGGGILDGVSTHFLVAAHVFLEMLHYAVWIVAIPALALRAAPWQLSATPLGRSSAAWRTALTAVFVLGGVVVLVLWAAFLGDYATTRDVYFTVALAHVLSEFPFLLRLL